MVPSICGKKNTMKQNNPCYLFGMYEPDTDSVIVNDINDTYTGTPLTISCEKCNSAVLLDTPDDIAYLYRLAQEVLCYMLNWLVNLMDYKNMWML